LPVRCRAAHGAPGIFFEADGAPFHGQRIKQQQTTAQRFANAGRQLQRLRRLHGADNAGQRGKDTHHRTADLFDILTFGEKAVIARRILAAQIVDADLAIEANGRARYQRLAMMNTGAVDGVTGGKIVRAVEGKVGRCYQRIKGGAG
jgi:hypothetical protein